MKPVLLTLLSFFFTSLLFPAVAQQTPAEEKIYVTVEQMPEFIGGQDSMMAFISRNMRYPQEALINNQQGVTIISFVVDASGKITKPQILKSAAPSLDEEAIRVIKSMPAWKPGKQNGNAVAVRINLPVRFQFATQPTPEAPGLEASEDSNPAGPIFELQPGDEQPQFPGGIEALMKFLAKNIKYPKEAWENRIEGLSIIAFVVDHRGYTGNYRILKPLGYGTDQEAIRVLQTMPKWIPGKRNGKPVKVKYTLPVKFSL